MPNHMTNSMTGSLPNLDGAAVQLDHSTSLAVCQGIGERLRDIMKPGAGQLTPRLQELLETLQQLDDSPSIVPDDGGATRAH